MTEAAGFPPPELAPPAELPPPDELAVKAVEDGAQAQGMTDDEITALLASVKAMQGRIAKLEAEKAATYTADVVKYAQAVRDHLAAYAAAHPDRDYKPLLAAADELITGARDAAESGKPELVQTLTGNLDKLVARLARRHRGVDYDYVRELLDEADEAAAQVAA